MGEQRGAIRQTLNSLHSCYCKCSSSAYFRGCCALPLLSCALPDLHSALPELEKASFLHTIFYGCAVYRGNRYTAVFRCTGTYRGTISEYRYTAAPNDRGLSYDSRRRSINTTSTSPTSPTVNVNKTYFGKSCVCVDT